MDGGRISKISVMRRFKYAIAFENARETDYVTGSSFDPLSGGTIPHLPRRTQHRGILPGDECCIDASAHPDPRTLARLIREKDFRVYHRWRGQPLRRSFMERERAAVGSLSCAVPGISRGPASAKA